MNTASTASSGVRVIFNTLSNCEILISLNVCSERAAKTKIPPSSWKILFPTSSALNPEESVYLTSDKSRMIFLTPSAWSVISSDFIPGQHWNPSFLRAGEAGCIFPACRSYTSCSLRFVQLQMASKLTDFREFMILCSILSNRLE